MKDLKELLLVGIIGLFALNGAAQEGYFQKYKDLSSKNDSVGLKNLLSEWETKGTKDPDLYVAYFNYYVKRSRKEIIAIEKTPRGKDSFVIKDTATGEPVGYMNSVMHYEAAEIKKGFDWIDKGIKLFPDRLDMRFGKVYMLGQTKDYTAFTNEIVRTIDYSGKNKNAWLWSENKPKSEGKKFMLGAMQDYIVQLYNVGDEQAGNMRKISEAILKYYPEHVESLSNLGISYIIAKDYDNALKYFLQAEKIAPEDYVVLSNIAFCYKEKGDKSTAVRYYELTEKYGTDEAKKFAKEKILELKK